LRTALCWCESESRFNMKIPVNRPVKNGRNESAVVIITTSEMGSQIFSAERRRPGEQSVTGAERPVQIYRVVLPSGEYEVG